MARIVTLTYRPKRPPRKKQPASPLAGPAVVTTKSSRRPRLAETAAEVRNLPRHAGEAAESIAPPAADDRKPEPGTKSAIVTVKRRRSRFGGAPDLTPEEHRRRGDAADALFREIVRQATE